MTATMTFRTPEQVDDSAEALVKAVAHAMFERKEIVISFALKQKCTARILAEMEDAINSLLSGTLRTYGAKRVPRHLLGLDLASAQWKDDGDNTVTIKLDFARLLGPKTRRSEVEPGRARGG